MLRTIISIWRDFSSQMKKQNISAYASSTAFFLFLSVIPMLMVVCAVLPYTPVTEQNLVTALTDVTPDIADAAQDGKVNMIAMATDGAVKAGAHAGNLIKGIAALVGGGGGGRPNMAQAGGKNPAGIPAAIAEASKVLEGQLA